MSFVTAGLKLGLFAILSLTIVPLQMAVLAVHRGQGMFILPRIWHKGVCLIFGLRLAISGIPPANDRQILYVANHLSYLDIPLIGAVLNASFVAKKEVETWPVFGFLSRLQKTVFIDRALRATGTARDSLNQGLAQGRSLILFPEGTSTDGRTVLDFKPSLFSIAFDSDAIARQDLVIQPLTIRLEQVGGTTPDSQQVRDIYAWHRDMTTELPVHLWRFARSSGAELTLIFHEALDPAKYTDRKALAQTAHIAVSNGLGNSTQSTEQEINTDGELPNRRDNKAPDLPAIKI